MKINATELPQQIKEIVSKLENVKTQQNGVLKYSVKLDDFIYIKANDTGNQNPNDLFKLIGEKFSYACIRVFTGKSQHQQNEIKINISAKKSLSGFEDEQEQMPKNTPQNVMPNQPETIQEYVAKAKLGWDLEHSISERKKLENQLEKAELRAERIAQELEKANDTIESLIEQQKELKETHKNDIWGKFSKVAEQVAPAVAPALGGFLSAYMPQGQSLGSLTIDAQTQEKIDFMDTLADTYGNQNLQAFFEILERHPNPKAFFTDIITRLNSQPPQQ